MTSFWKKLARKPRKVLSTLEAADFAKHYSDIMTDDENDLTESQRRIVESVDGRYRSASATEFNSTLSGR